MTSVPIKAVFVSNQSENFAMVKKNAKNKKKVAEFTVPRLKPLQTLKRRQEKKKHWLLTMGRVCVRQVGKRSTVTLRETNSKFALEKGAELQKEFHLATFYEIGAVKVVRGEV